MLAWHESRHTTHNRAAERALARRSWSRSSTRLIRIGSLGIGATVMLALFLNSSNILALVSIGLAALVVAPLVLRAVRWENRRRTTISRRDLLWTQRELSIIESELEALWAPGAEATPGWSRLLSMVYRKPHEQLVKSPREDSTALEQ